jgi:hypothetical protein
MVDMSDVEMRFGEKKDLPLITSVIRDGMKEGFFNFTVKSGLSQFESELSEAIDRRERGEVCADFLFVFDSKHQSQVIGLRF